MTVLNSGGLVAHATTAMLAVRPMRMRDQRRGLARLIRAAALFIFAALLAPLADYAATADLPPSVNEYLDALNAIQTSKERQSLQPVFELAIKSSPGIQPVLETLSEADYAALKNKLQGFILSRGQAVFVRPSGQFFQKLAKAKGTKADRAFFDIYVRTEPDQSAMFPAYIRQQTGDDGCTLFDSPLMIGLYRKWLGFRTSYPDEYATEAQGEIDSMDQELLGGTCACEDKDKVTAGLTAFANALPDLPITPRIRARVARIQNGTSRIRFNCHSG
ncbi:MAG: hypothetical protein ACLQDV_02365 [Candidatus Binataceae bacterium]